MSERFFIQVFLIFLIFMSALSLFIYKAPDPIQEQLTAYQWGLRYGKSQCYPYAAPFSDAPGQGGNQ